MPSLPGFTVDIDQNPYLPVGGRDVSAVVTVTADASGDMPSPGPGGPADASGGSAEIIIVDCSGSMDHPESEIREARAATAAAVDVLTDGTWFAVVAGTVGTIIEAYDLLLYVQVAPLVFAKLYFPSSDFRGSERKREGCAESGPAGL